MASNEATEAARTKLAEERKIREQSQREYEDRMRGRPTPTQEEIDLSALGGNITEHEDDGSGPDPGQQPREETRQIEAEKPTAQAQSYHTRTISPKPARRESE